jgi:hypothetical protein
LKRTPCRFSSRAVMAGGSGLVRRPSGSTSIADMSLCCRGWGEHWTFGPFIRQRLV